MNIRSLFDETKKESNDATTNSFVGGGKSGLSVQHSSCTASDSFTNNALKPHPPNARKITLYKNGFIIDGGEFRSFSDPENEEFISKVKAGYAPKELHNVGLGPISLVLEDLSSSTYNPPPPPKYLLFSGEGQSTSTGNSIVPTTAVMPSNSRVHVDYNKPITVIRFRFYDGTTVRQQFNETQTVEDLYNYVFEIAPLSCDYQLLCGFPPSPITSDLSLTLKEAGLLNKTIFQRCCT